MYVWASLDLPRVDQAVSRGATGQEVREKGFAVLHNTHSKEGFRASLQSSFAFDSIHPSSILHPCLCWTWSGLHSMISKMLLFFSRLHVNHTKLTVESMTSMWVSIRTEECWVGDMACQGWSPIKIVSVRSEYWAATSQSLLFLSFFLSFYFFMSSFSQMLIMTYDSSSQSQIVREKLFPFDLRYLDVLSLRCRVPYRKRWSAKPWNISKCSGTRRVDEIDLFILLSIANSDRNLLSSIVLLLTTASYFRGLWVTASGVILARISHVTPKSCLGGAKTTSIFYVVMPESV